MRAIWRVRGTDPAAIAAVLLLLAGAGPAFAGDGDFELTPYGGFAFGGSFEDEDSETRVDLDDDASFGLIFNLRESGNTQWELIYAHQGTSADTADVPGLGPSVDIDLDYLQLGGTYQGPGERLRPYLALTLGGTRIAPGSASLDSDTFWSFSLGTGLQLNPTNRLGLRLEARAWGTLVDSDSGLFCLSDVQGAACAIALDGKLLWQVEAFAGVVFRF